MALSPRPKSKPKIGGREERTNPLATSGRRLDQDNPLFLPAKALLRTRNIK